MAISIEQLQKEKDYLEKVKEKINLIIADLNKTIKSSTDSINDLKRFMWENISDYTDDERGMALYDVDASVKDTNATIEELRRYKKAVNSPYFGKIVFKNDGDEIPIYIGITTVNDNRTYLVFDWRAPISSLFYNYELGKAEYDSPNGTVTGEILSKMQFKIENGQLIRCFDSDINIDDEYLQDILASSSSERMKSIVSTIQREQNEIIRNEKDKYLIVQGAAGSGKTSVALHRIAYLLYRNLNLNSNNILIFSPNDIFSDYISNVLPELGENNVLKTTISEFSEAFLKGHKIEAYSDFLERVYADKAKDYDLIHYKFSDDYYHDLKTYIHQYISSIVFTKDIVVNNRKVSSENLNILMHKYAILPLNERLDSLTTYICENCHISSKKFGSQIRKMVIESGNIDLDQYHLYQSFIKNYSNSKTIHYEDITGLLYVYFSLNGYPNYNQIKQVVIDEAQDYSVFQLDLLKKIFKKSSFTILGDINQGINPHYQYNSLKQIADLFGDNSKYLELTKTYRSSEEIIDYSNTILDINNACSVRRENHLPVDKGDCLDNELIPRLEEDIASMTNEKLNRIAIITRDVKTAIKIFNKLKKNDDSVELVSTSKGNVNSHVVVIPSYLSKGLEFDGVISYNTPNDPYQPDEQNLFYVVCTRAQHKLNVYNEPTYLFKGRNLQK